MDIRGIALVTSKNHAWAAEVTGLTVEEVKEKFEEARKNELVCTIPMKKGFHP